MNQKQASQVKDLAKPCNGVLKKLGWKWEPQNGSWYIWNNQKHPVLNSLSTCSLSGSHDNWLRKKVKDADPATEDIIPILHWEEIERVLEGVGYMLSFETHYEDEPPKIFVLYKVTILEPATIKGKWGNETITNSWEGKAKSRQEAVMLAVIELGKEINGS